MSAVLAPPTLNQILGPQWKSPWWRLNHLYHIVDEHGKAIPFRPNDEQTEYYNNLWYRNIILKSRKLGFSTLELLLNLDQALFNKDYSGIVIADTRENGGNLFSALEFAYDHLPEALKLALPLKSRESKSRLEFVHGSKVSVTTSARGGTPQNLHVSEMGKIGAREPAKALEIVTGSFEAVPIDGRITVESTAEGNSGQFHDLVMTALKRQQEGLPETRLDFRLHFFAWYRKKTNRLEAQGVVISPEMEKYFRELEAKLGITFDAEQRAWYVKKQETLGRKMKREHPTTPQESFEVAIEGGVYADELAQMRERGRFLDIPIDPNEPVNTFWDLGTNNATAIWMHQFIGMQNRFVAYHQDTGRGLQHYKNWLADWAEEHGIRWGRHYLPHDANLSILGEDVTTKYAILTSGMNALKNAEVVPRISDITTGIEVTRAAMVRDTYIDRERCAEGIKCLDAYQYKWDENRGQWSSEPLHNWASDGADSFRGWAQGYRSPRARSDDERARRSNKPRNWKTM